MDNKNLILYFSWGRRAMVEKTLPVLLDSLRPDDRILVVDQGMYNFDFYEKYKDKIDFLHFTKLNYEIGSVWQFLNYFLSWKDVTRRTLYHGTGNRNVKPQNWYPDFINIVESDALVSDGWIDKLEDVFKLNSNIAVVSGYHGPENRPKLYMRSVMIKDVVSGVNVMARVDYFRKILSENILHVTSQDCHFSEIVRRDKKLIAVLPNIVTHIGGDVGKIKGFIK